jgi:hypothetical protein
MRRPPLRSTSLTMLWLLAFTPFIQAHSWVEQLTVIAPNGSFTGAPGFARGNVLRTTAGFNDGTMVNLIPPNGRSTGNAILSTDLMCKSTQTIGSQTSGSPALIASPGDMVALRYQENGHVTLPENQPGKPANRGTIFIYGTTKPSNSDTLLGIHKVWTADGKGGDGRGVLLATRNYDDGQCYQVNGGTISKQRQKEFAHKPNSLMGGDLWCQADVTLPNSIDGSSYTLYWVWDWPTAAGTEGLPNGLNETYTTCMDINISSGSGTSNSVSFAKGQDLNSAAIESELLTAFNVPVTATAAAGQSAAASTTPQAHQTTAAASAAATSNSGNRVGVVTVTEMIHDTVTVYKTYSPLPKSTASLLSEAPNGSIIVQPFHTGKSAAPTTLATKAVNVVVTTVQDVVVVSQAVTLQATATTTAPKIRGRLVRS